MTYAYAVTAVCVVHSQPLLLSGQPPDRPSEIGLKLPPPALSPPSLAALLHDLHATCCCMAAALMMATLADG